MLRADDDALSSSRKLIQAVLASGRTSTDGANLSLPGLSGRRLVRKRQVRVGIRGDLSFATFSLHGRQRKVELYY